jgi:hypothetical protein
VAKVLNCDTDAQVLVSRVAIRRTKAVHHHADAYAGGLSDPPGCREHVLRIYP